MFLRRIAPRLLESWLDCKGGPRGRSVSLGTWEGSVKKPDSTPADVSIAYEAFKSSSFMRFFPRPEVGTNSTGPQPRHG